MLFTPKIGRVGVAICQDLNFPDYIGKAPRLDVLVQPSYTWGHIGKYHAEGNAIRAIEQGLFSCAVVTIHSAAFICPAKSGGALRRPYRTILWCRCVSRPLEAFGHCTTPSAMVLRGCSSRCLFWSGCLWWFPPKFLSDSLQNGLFLHCHWKIGGLSSCLAPKYNEITERVTDVKKKNTRSTKHISRHCGQPFARAHCSISKCPCCAA